MRLDKLLTLTHGNSVYGAAFSPKGDRLATASLDNTVRLWSLPDGAHVGTLKGHGDGVAFVGFLPDGQIVTASLDRTLRIWSADGSDSRSINTGHQEIYLACAAVSRSGNLLASGGFDRTVRLFDGNSLNPLAVLSGHEATVQSVAFSNSEQRLASSGDDLTIRLWDVAKGALIKTLTGHSRAVEAVAFAPDDKLLASAGADGALKLWTGDGDPLASLDTPGVQMKCATFSPDGRWLVAGSADGAIRIWDHADRQLVLTQPSHRNTIYGVAFNTDGTQLASSGFDRTICVWNVVSQ